MRKRLSFSLLLTVRHMFSPRHILVSCFNRWKNPIKNETKSVIFGSGLVSKLSLVILSLMINCLTAFAQLQSYSCDFEDENENSRWVLNAGVFGPDCVNRWYIGSASNNGGLNGFYISNDGGLTAGYVGSSLVSVSYRTLTLVAGSYELGFDWQAGASRTNAFYVCWIPDTVAGINSNINGFLPKWVEKYAIAFNDTIGLTSANWHADSDTIESDGTPHKLVFLWNNKIEEPAFPGACIDNINIVPVNECGKPYGLDITALNNKVTLSWQGDSDSYDLRFKASSDNIWHEYTGLTFEQFEVEDIGEGVIDMYVRAHCGNSYTVWVSYSKFIFFYGSRCIEYLDLNNRNCYYGHFDNPRAYRGVVDFGPYNMQSRHTIHYDPIERDPRTDNRLKTVPDGELASVRLGNWDINGEAEIVEYKFTVDASMSAILLLKYAVVLENPGHDKEEQPRFTLSILNEGLPLDEYGCGEADFSAGYADGKWEKSLDGAVEWKDWTTVGINLAQYDGETLTIRLTTYDCTALGHYGYAYFTLGCSDGKIQGLSCGETPTEAFKAPDGFKYAWYRPENPSDILGTGQLFPVEPNDTFIYYCNVIQPTNPDCYYTVSATAIPRWPVAVASYALVSRDCKNIASFKNESYVELVNPITKDTVILDQSCETAHWDFGDGTTSDIFNPQHEFPSEGGKYTVTLTSGLAGDLCQSEYSFQIDLPGLNESTDTVQAFVCKGSPYEFHGINHYSTGYYNDTTIDPLTGCRVIEVLDLTAIGRTDTIIFDTVCSADLPYIFNGVEYWNGGTHVAELKNFIGCDSIVSLQLYVSESLRLEISGTVEVCADNAEITVPFEIESGVVSSCTVSCDALPGLDSELRDNTVVILMPDNLRPGTYRTDMTFYNMECGDYHHTIDISVLYPDSIVVQRWSDVMAVRNAAYNGYYEFVAYQWYENGQVIPGAVTPNLYLPSGLAVGSVYSVALTRMDDGVTAFTCAKEALDLSSVEETPLVVVSGGTVSVNSNSAGVARLWTVSGVLAAGYPLYDGITDITFRVTAGVYVLEINMDNGFVSKEKIIISEN